MSLNASKLVHPIDLPILGTMTFGRQIEEKQSHAILDAFVNKHNGVWIDVAEIYPVPVTEERAGATERIVGTWLASKPKEFRKTVAIASKVAGPSPNKAYSKRGRQDFTRQVIRQALEDSLQRLQTDYLDLYQLHWPSRAVPLWGEEKFTLAHAQGKYSMRPADDADVEPVPFDDVVLTMGELIAEGKILSWGLSNETPYGICQFNESSKRLAGKPGVIPPLSLQQDFSMMDRRSDGAIAECLFHYGMKFLVYGGLAGGTLTGKYLPFAQEQDSNKRSKLEQEKAWRHILFPKFQARYHTETAMETTKKYSQVAEQYKVTMVQLALGFCATRHYIANGNGGVILGANDVQTLDEDVLAIKEAEKFWTDDIEAAVLAVHREKPNPHVIY